MYIHVIFMYIHAYSCIFMHISIKMYKVYYCLKKKNLFISLKPSMFCHGDVELHITTPFF